MTTSAPRSPEAPAEMSPAELLYGDFVGEHAATRRILGRYPDGKGEWRPHERSKSLGELATHVADIVNRGTTVLETDGMQVGVRPAAMQLDSASELVVHFDAALEKLNDALAATDFDKLAKPWTIRAGDRIIFEAPRRIMLRQIMMSHLVHHRAQLGVYYRLLGVPVPGTYGATADE